MQIFLDKVLDTPTLHAITEQLADDTLFEAGTVTAGRTARQVKNNQQARAVATEVRGAARLVEKALFAHPVFNAAAQPQKLAKILFSRYRPGMCYGTHVDDPYIADTRTDLSFTLFLSDPADYDGGELVIQRHDGDEPVKLAAGGLVLYPSSSLHQVTEVTRGERFAAVGWIQSRVRLAEQRETLFDLYNALAQLPDTKENQPARLSLLKVRGNLMRLWCD